MKQRKQEQSKRLVTDDDDLASFEYLTPFNLDIGLEGHQLVCCSKQFRPLDSLLYVYADT